MPPTLPPAPVSLSAVDLKLPPSLQSSPTLQKWQQQVPDVAADIDRDPAFRPRLRLGYQHFSRDGGRDSGGWQLRLEDLRLGKTPVTASANYLTSSDGRDREWGGDLHYSLMPLGKSFQIAPAIGYRRLTHDQIATTGVNLGWRTRLILSRPSAADITFDQTWVALGTERETGISRLSFGYAIAPNFRIATDFQHQHSQRQKSDRWGIALEWMPRR
ncbi:MAG: hypothetical protein RLZZ511_3246 [Cyanobacteriota bacterium]